MPAFIRLLTQQDGAALEAFLQQYAASSLFMLNNLAVAGVNYRGQVFQGEYWGAWSEQGDLVGLLVQYWNGSLMIQAPLTKVRQTLIDYFQTQPHRFVSAILGDEQQAISLIKNLGLLPKHFALNRVEGLYELPLTQLKTPTLAHSPALQVALITEADRTVLEAWLRAYHIEALAAQDGMSLRRRIAERVDKLYEKPQAWLLKQAQQPLALSAFNARLDTQVQIGPVWTPPEQRNRGYARYLVAQTLVQARVEGIQTAYLFTDNPAARKAYQAVGFQQIGQYRLAFLH